MHFNNDFNKIIYKFSALDKSLRISAEDEKLCLYMKSNSGVESFSVTDVAESIKINPGQSIIFIVLNRDKSLRYLFIEILFLWLLKIKRSKKIDENYISKSYRTARKYFHLIFDKIIFKKENSNSFKFSKNNQGSIQFYKNREDHPITLSYSNSIIFANISPTIKERLYLKNEANNLSNFIDSDKSISASSPHRILIFYLDNISRKTSFELLSDSKRCPNISKIFTSRKFIRTNQTCESNWTFPTAISMSSCKRFEEHMIYHPELKPYTILNQSIYNSISNIHLESLANTYPNRFRCGTNWRMKPEHGLHYFYKHCMHNHLYGDLYDTFAQVIKQLDIASTSKSLHWIDIMDSHDPIKNSVLPFGAKHSLSTDTIVNGLHYGTGPKSIIERNSAKNSSLDIYTSQLINIDRVIGNILEYSYLTVPEKDHLLFFVSDHGHSFPNQQTLFEKLKEKHQSLCGFFWEGLDTESFDKYSNLSISSSDILPLLNTICFDSLDFGQSFLDCKYSQIFFPGARYEFIYFYTNDIIYRYQTINTLPGKENSLDNTLQDKYNLENILKYGTWQLIDKDVAKTVDSSKLPKKINESFDTVINKWLSFNIN